MIESQDENERAAKVMIPGKNILQRSIIHLHHLECNAEEKSNEIPNKINSKVNCKREELKKRWIKN